MARGNMIPSATTLPDDELRFVEGLALGKPLKELASDLGWSEDKAQRLARSSRTIAAVATIGVQQVQLCYVPRALQTVFDLMRGVCKAPSHSNIAKDEYVPVKPETRLAAAQTILKIGGLEARAASAAGREHDTEDLSALSPDQLRGLISTLEERLGDQATPVSAPDDVPDAEVATDYPDISSLLD